MIQISNKAITGLKNSQLPHMESFGKTPCCCSSTKLAELSKPEFLASCRENQEIRHSQ
jgi:hypothetical protein